MTQLTVNKWIKIAWAAGILGAIVVISMILFSKDKASIETTRLTTIEATKTQQKRTAHTTIKRRPKLRRTVIKDKPHDEPVVIEHTHQDNTKIIANKEFTLANKNDNKQPSTLEPKPPPVDEKEPNKPELVPESTFEYKDKINKKVLGPSTWMARPTKDESEKINRALDASPAAAIQDKNERRQLAHQAANTAAQKAQRVCLDFEPLQAKKGVRRILLTAQIRSKGKRVYIHHIKMNSQVGIFNDAYLLCVVKRLRNMPLGVEAPISFDTSLALSF